METANPRYLSLLRNSARVASSANWPQVFTLLSVSCERRHGNQIQDCNCSWSNLSLPLHPESDVGPRQFTLSDWGNASLSWSYPDSILCLLRYFSAPNPWSVTSTLAAHLVLSMIMTMAQMYNHNSWCVLPKQMLPGSPDPHLTMMSFWLWWFLPL